MSEEKKAAASAPATAKTAVKNTDQKPGFFKRVVKWLRDKKSELKKVVWPTPKQAAKNTGVAVCMIVVCALVIWAFDSAEHAAVTALLDIFS